MKRSEIIIKITAEQHRITAAELTSKCVKRYVVAARRDAMTAMKAEGLSVARIAEAVGQSKTTVREHLDPEWRAYRKAYRAQKYRERRDAGEARV